MLLLEAGEDGHTDEEIDSEGLTQLNRLSLQLEAHVMQIGMNAGYINRICKRKAQAIAAFNIEKRKIKRRRTSCRL
eukprot:279825-Rhodomonas_salina.1